MVRLRLKRMGRTHQSFFRVSAIDARAPRDGRVLEELGWYDPHAKDPEKRVALKLDRIQHWLGVGAVPSETVGDLLKGAGLSLAKPSKSARKRVRAKRAKAAKAAQAG